MKKIQDLNIMVTFCISCLKFVLVCWYTSEKSDFNYSNNLLTNTVDQRECYAYIFLSFTNGASLFPKNQILVILITF